MGRVVEWVLAMIGVTVILLGLAEACGIVMRI